jgi:hypothetical protein
MRHVGSSWTVKGAMCLVAGAGATLHAGRLGPRGPQRGAGAAGAAALPDYVAKQASKQAN